MNYIKNGKWVFLIIIFFIPISYKSSIIFTINYFISFLKMQIEFKKNENYLNLCNDIKLTILKNFKQSKNPKISIISPIFNRDRYILRFIKSLQYQSFNNIEIILIDDCSIDQSSKEVEKYQQKDKRIILIKNKKNKGTLISRNIGVLYSKGRYLILPDPDDILSKNIIFLCYKYAEKNKYEMIRFNLYLGSKTISFPNIVKNLDNRVILQPELSTYNFYGNHELQIIDLSLSNKFIRKDLYLKSLNELHKFYLNVYMIYMEDTIINIILYRIAKNLYFLKRIGYYYIIHSQSITNNLGKLSELKIKFSFILLQLIFDYTKNTKYEKDMANTMFTVINRRFNIERMLLTYDMNLDFFYNIIEKYLNSKFITNDNKKILNIFKNIIKRRNKIK